MGYNPNQPNYPNQVPPNQPQRQGPLPGQGQPPSSTPPGYNSPYQNPPPGYGPPQYPPQGYYGTPQYPPQGYYPNQYPPQGYQVQQGYNQKKSSSGSISGGILALMGSLALIASCFMPWVSASNQGESMHINSFGSIGSSFINWFPSRLDFSDVDYTRDGFITLGVGVLLLVLSLFLFATRSKFLTGFMVFLGAGTIIFLVRKIIDFFGKIHDTGSQISVGLGLYIGAGAALVILIGLSISIKSGK